MAAAAGVAAGTGRGGGEGEELLPNAVEGDGGCGGGDTCAGDRPWRLNFDGLRRPEAHQEKPPRRFHDRLGVLVQSPGDDVAEYLKKQQSELLEGFNEMDTLTDRGFLPGMSKEECEKVARSEALAIRLSNIANMVLFAAKVYASIRSGSLAIIASTLDSLLDLLSGFILWFTAFSKKTSNPYRYPIGKRRMQPLGILVFASVMATLGLQIILESTRSLFYDLAIYTIRTWSMTVLENVHSLVGQSASPEYLQKLTYLCWNHHKAVRHIDTVRAYTFGSHYFVEVDIVLPCDMPLQEAHDIGEAPQEKLESLPEIERAFVHLDYEFTHQPEHARSHDTL
ncbi:metal tolerance protein 6 isoform X2 [Oryza glaberrima]|uniref:metal tolerance protein 6 isoform X2 n=1 Tax=Oryza glaberrima TaxID=4538 RepID=UPI00224C2806|nr:metal tolerance protein 6 isoform X2 [Oryza glaberrima]